MTGTSKFMIGSAAVAMGLLLMAGCNSTKKAAPEEAVGVATVGLDTCFNCHADGSLGRFPTMIGNAGTPNVGWLYSAHGNYEAVDQSFQPIDLGVYNDGFPFYAFSEWNSTCETCHDPLGDGKRISLIDALYGAEIGRIDRPVIGCETCHGPGGNHFGLGPIPDPKPDSAVCGQCHTDAVPDDHLPFHPEGDRIYEDYQASRHAKSIAAPTYVGGSATDVTAKCSRCHTEEGVKLYGEGVPGTSSYDEIEAFFDDKPKPDVINASPVQCKTCHDVHNQGKALLAAATTGPPAQSEQFNTCTTCHQLNKTDGTVLPDAYHDPSVNSYGSLDEVITDTHAAVPGDTRLNTGPSKVPLFFVNKGDARSCLGCHNPHAADTTINKQYARSGHGDTTADAWIHYDWKHSGRRDCQRCHTSTGFKNYADALIASTVYDPANNDFSYLLGNDDPGARVDTNDQLETIYCWGCHTDFKGGMRNPGAITADYSVFISSVKYADVSYDYPDVSKSNVCMACHTGRENGESIAQLNLQGGMPAADFSNLSFINSHYLTAGGTVFTATGYEYTGKSYTNPASYKHELIGSVAAPGTGTSGPCAGCHMSAPESHLFLPVTRDVNGVITAITSPVCSTCHPTDPSGEALSLTPTVLENQKALLRDSLEALLRQLDARGYYFRNANPYFFQRRYDTGTVSVANGSTTVTGTGTSWTTASISAGNDQFKVNRDGTYYVVASVTDDTHLVLATAYTGPTVTDPDLATYAIIKSGSANAMKNWLTQSGPAPFATPDLDTTGVTSGKNNMGAAFNYNLLEHDPGAFAHNRYYAKRLIYDAIDWLDDDDLNDSVNATLTALDAVDHPYKADAISYILSGTGGRP